MSKITFSPSSFQYYIYDMGRGHKGGGHIWHGAKGTRAEGIYEMGAGHKGGGHKSHVVDHGHEELWTT